MKHDNFIMLFAAKCEQIANIYSLHVNDVYFAKLANGGFSSFGGERVCARYPDEAIARVTWQEFAEKAFSLGYNTAEDADELINHGL